MLIYTNIIFERPNFGYDFGGYKDAFLYIIENNLSVERLILLNDSTWFPISSEKDLIRQMEQSNTDFTGALEVDDGRYLRGKNNFYASFFLMFSWGRGDVMIVNLSKFVCQVNNSNQTCLRCT